jgi:transcriptional regulator with XRE-family HTH domain
MFRQLPVRLDPPGAILAVNLAEDLFRAHPVALIAHMENYWSGRYNLNGTPASDPKYCPNEEHFGFSLGHPYRLSDEPAMPPNLQLPLAQQPQPVQGNEGLPSVTVGSGDARRDLFPCPRLRWDHLIYAYMIENTRVYEIFRRVLHEYLHGEKFGVPLEGGTPETTADAQHWLRNTEELFYRDSAPFLISNVSSYVRSDLRANRRNAYQRMFSMDLNHGTDDGKPYPYVKAEAANSSFVATFEEFLREVWVGITYVGATSSSNPTDDSKISELAEKLHNTLQSRRLSGNLSREEFAFVSMMSWFHMTLEFNSPIVKSLRAEAVGVENRLFKIAERVGLPAHGLSKSFFDIADPISRLLIQIEMGTYNDSNAVRPLYDHKLYPDGPEREMRTIITHWTAITGHDVKARKVSSN